MGLFEHFPYTNFHDLNLDWLLKTCVEVKEQVDNLDEWRSLHEQEYEQLKELYNDIITGHFPDSVKNAFYTWMNTNAVSIVGSMVKNVFFGLTDDGHFVVNIPSSWADIQFSTSGLDITIPNVEYGHLVLKY